MQRCKPSTWVLGTSHVLQPSTNRLRARDQLELSYRIRVFALQITQTPQCRDLGKYNPSGAERFLCPTQRGDPGSLLPSHSTPKQFLSVAI